MRRPKWLAALVFALVLAGSFAWLGQWQMDIAITPEDPEAVSFEEVRDLADVAAPGESVTDLAAGAVLSTTGSFVPGDFSVVETRVNQGVEGVWVTAHFETEQGHLPVAVGWAETAAEAREAIAQIDAKITAQSPTIELTGRYMPPDAAMLPGLDDDPQLQTTMVPGHLVNVWNAFEGPSYAGFLVTHVEGSDLSPVTDLQSVSLAEIDSLPPLPQETINWLNVFYAVEWIVFGGFAIFFWYRLVRDEWEKEHELQLLRLAEVATPGVSTTPTAAQ